MACKCTEKAEQNCKSYPNCYGCNAFRNPTNYDHIRKMSIEEMAVFMNECGHDFPPYCDSKRSENCDQNCLNCAKEWLERGEG